MMGRQGGDQSQLFYLFNVEGRPQQMSSWPLASATARPISKCWHLIHANKPQIN
jgi:hypothetical protein